MKVILITATAAVVLCLLPTESYGAQPPVKPTTTEPPKKAVQGKPGLTDPTCQICGAFSRTNDLKKCIDDPEILKALEAVKAECKKIVEQCPSSNSTFIDLQDVEVDPGKKKSLERPGTKVAVINILCIACFTTARFNDVIQCLLSPKDLLFFEAFMSACSMSFFMCYRT